MKRMFILFASLLICVPAQADEEWIIGLAFEVLLPDGEVSKPSVAVPGADQATLKIGLDDGRMVNLAVFAAHPDENGVEVMVDGDLGVEGAHVLTESRRLLWDAEQEFVLNDGSGSPVTVKMIPSRMTKSEFMRSMEQGG